MSVFDDLELYIWPDPTVVKMKVNGSPDRGAIVIPYDSESEGSYAFVKAGMTLIVKNAGQAGYNVRVRIKSITADEVTVAENGVIWSNNQDLEVVKTYEVWGVAPRIVTSGGVTTVYKDYDIPFTDQLRRFEPVVNMGSHYAGPIGEPVYFSSSGSFDPQGDTLLTPNWLIENSEDIAYTGATPGYVRFITPGAHIASCEYVNSNGKRFTGRRHILIGEPIRGWGISSFEGGRERGGYSVKIWLYEYVSYLREGSLIIIRSKENVTNDPRGNIVFVGYVMQKSLKFNYTNNRIEFEAVSVNGVMDKLDVYGATTAFAESYDPAIPYWFQIYRQTVDKAVIAFLRWHTTVLTVTDFHQVGNTYFVEKIDFPRGGAANPVREILQGTIQADMLCDVQSNLWAEYIQNQRPLADRTTVVKEVLQPHMWRSDPEIIDHEMSEISYLEMGGVAYTGPTGTMVAALAGFPSTVPGRFGRVENIQGLVLNPIDYQTYLNEITGHVYADKTNRFPDMKFPMSGNRRDYDIAPHKWTYLSLVKDFANFSNIRISPTDISHIYNPRQKSLLTDITFEAEIVGVPAVTVPIPPPEPEEPPAPNPPPPVIEPPVVETIKVVVFHNRYHVVRCANFFDLVNAPVWEDITPTIFDHVNDSILSFDVDIDGVGAWLVTDGPNKTTTGVFRTSDVISGSFSLVLSQDVACKPTTGLGNVELFAKGWMADISYDRVARMQSCISFGNGCLCVTESQDAGGFGTSPPSVAYVSSDEGKTWTANVIAGTYNPGGPWFFTGGGFGLSGCHHLAWDGSTIYAVGWWHEHPGDEAGGLATSTDGRNWVLTKQSTSYDKLFSCNVLGGVIYAWELDTISIIILPATVYHAPPLTSGMFGYRRTTYGSNLVAILASTAGTELYVGTSSVMPSGGGAATISVNNGGGGYTLGDSLTLAVLGSGTPAVVTVTGVSGGVVTSVSRTSSGSGYVVGTYATTGGTGAGCTINILTLSNVVPPFGIAFVLTGTEWITVARDAVIVGGEVVTYYLSGVLYNKTGNLATAIGGGWEGSPISAPQDDSGMVVFDSPIVV